MTHLVPETPCQPKPEDFVTSPHFSTKLQNRAAQPHLAPGWGCCWVLGLSLLHQLFQKAALAWTGFCEEAQEGRLWGGHQSCTVLSSSDLSHSSSPLTHPPRPVQSGCTGVSFPVIEVPGWATWRRPPANKRQCRDSRSGRVLTASALQPGVGGTIPAKPFRYFRVQSQCPGNPTTVHPDTPGHLPGAPFWTRGPGARLLSWDQRARPCSPGSTACYYRVHPQALHLTAVPFTL